MVLFNYKAFFNERKNILFSHGPRLILNRSLAQEAKHYHDPAIH